MAFMEATRGPERKDKVPAVRKPQKAASTEDLAPCGSACRCDTAQSKLWKSPDHMAKVLPSCGARCCAAPKAPESRWPLGKSRRLLRKVRPKPPTEPAPKAKPTMSTTRSGHGRRRSMPHKGIKADFSLFKLFTSSLRAVFKLFKLF